MPDQLHTTADVAGVLRVSDRTVQLLARRGDIGSVRVGKHYRFADGHVDSYITRNSTPGRRLA